MNDRTIAVEVLDALPRSVLGGMLERVGADPNDQVTAHPELWEQYELPDPLRRVEPRQTVAVAVPDEPLNNDAAAIGLGLEHCDFDPETFDALVYDPPDVTGTAISFTAGNTVLGIDPELDSPATAVDALLDRTAELGLLTDPSDVPVTEMRVAELIQSQSG